MNCYKQLRSQVWILFGLLKILCCIDLVLFPTHILRPEITDFTKMVKSSQSDFFSTTSAAEVVSLKVLNLPRYYHYTQPLNSHLCIYLSKR